MRILGVSVSVLVLSVSLSADLFAAKPAKNVARVLEPGNLPDDLRLGAQRLLRDAYHPWVPATTKQGWKKQADAIRTRVLVSTGLWPMPPKTPLKPVVHGKIDRGDYTIEKVFFASYPGHYVTGNLYRPAKIEGQVPGVLCPHGHWPNGRFHDAGSQGGRRQIDQQAEKHMSGARYPLQARMVQLARMGCVVFHYDMVGYADSQQIAHRVGFTDVEAGLRLQNFMGLQTFNSIRALDFLMSLPEVDPKRIGVTGSSGGGTQTFMLGAIDPRPAVAFPAVMVSTAMQGGCICENSSYLRVGINNIALAALFAPKPMALSGADDWTIAIETKGYPELKQVYSYYERADLVDAKAFPQFGHNYNQVAREMMYAWFNEHLKLGQTGPIQEEDFWPVPIEELSVFDDEHPLPDDATSSEQLRRYLTQVAQRQFQELLPSDPNGWAEYRRVVGAAARVMLDEGVPNPDDLQIEKAATWRFGHVKATKGTVGRKGAGEAVPFVSLVPESYNGTMVLWIDGHGKSHLFDDNGLPTAAVARLLESGRGVASADVFLTGEFVADGKKSQLPNVNSKYQGYTFGYNRPVLSNRVRDILTTIALLSRNTNQVKSLHLVGTGAAGTWVLLARALAGKHVDQTVVDLDKFAGFESIGETSDAMFLPGALKYGGLGGLAALAAPAKLSVYTGSGRMSLGELSALVTAYSQTQGPLRFSTGRLERDKVVDEILK